MHFVHVDRGWGYVKSPRLSTRGGEGVKNCQNLVHVVVDAQRKETQEQDLFRLVKKNHI